MLFSLNWNIDYRRRLHNAKISEIKHKQGENVKKWEPRYCVLNQ